MEAKHPCARNICVSRSRIDLSGFDFCKSAKSGKSATHSSRVYAHRQRCAQPRHLVVEDITTSDGRFVDFAGLSVMTTERHTGFPKPNITIEQKTGAQSTWGRWRYKLDAQNTNASPGRLMSVE